MAFHFIVKRSASNKGLRFVFSHVRRTVLMKSMKQTVLMSKWRYFTVYTQSYRCNTAKMYFLFKLASFQKFQEDSRCRLDVCGRLLTVRGPKLFTVTGDAYYHLLNISLCGNNGQYPLASCLSNMTSSNAKHKVFIVLLVVILYFTTHTIVVVFVDTCQYYYSFLLVDMKIRSIFVVSRSLVLNFLCVYNKYMHTR